MVCLIVTESTPLHDGIGIVALESTNQREGEGVLVNLSNVRTVQ